MELHIILLHILYTYTRIRILYHIRTNTYVYTCVFMWNVWRLTLVCTSWACIFDRQRWQYESTAQAQVDHRIVAQWTGSVKLVLKSCKHILFGMEKNERWSQPNCMRTIHLTCAPALPHRPFLRSWAASAQETERPDEHTLCTLLTLLTPTPIIPPPRLSYPALILSRR